MIKRLDIPDDASVRKMSDTWVEISRSSLRYHGNLFVVGGTVTTHKIAIHRAGSSWFIDFYDSDERGGVGFGYTARPGWKSLPIDASVVPDGVKDLLS